jgi:hypothetical protein
LGSTNISSLANNAAGTNYQVNPSNRSFKLDDLGSSFEATAIADVSCSAGLVWASSLGRCVVEPTVNVDVTPDVIRSNNTASVSISVDSTYDLTCTLTGGINQTISHTGSATPQTYTATTAPLTSAQIVTSTCEASVSSDIVGIGEARVEVIPVIQEI